MSTLAVADQEIVRRYVKAVSVQSPGCGRDVADGKQLPVRVGGAAPRSRPAAANSDGFASRESRVLMAAVTDQKTVTFSGRCIYCSARCYGRACGSHMDLLLIEQQEMAA